MQLRLFVEVLPRIPQVERDFRDAGGARGGVGALAGEALGPDGGLLVSKRTVRPLPCHLAVGLGEFSWRVQVVAVDGVGLAFDHCRYRHGAAGGGQVDVLGCAGAVAAARAVFAQQAAVFCVDVAVAQLFCVAGAGAPEFAEEEVEDLLDEAGLFALWGLVAVSVIAIIGQQVVQVLGAGGFVCGAVASSGEGLLKAQQAVGLAGLESNWAPPPDG